MLHDFVTEILNGWKKLATLQPNNWLAETPQALVPRRPGRQSAERERISGIDWNVILRRNRRLNSFEPSLD
ncbi:hypothetical protein [Peribacillus frigoritolerans]|uniref:hypothetical protein n=1 Tax=Peribacillus frigoritolerans TaxID=450367 RepID=UPI0031D3BD3F